MPRIIWEKSTQQRAPMDRERAKCFFVTTYSKMSEWMNDRPPGDSRLRRLKADKDKIWYSKTTYRCMTAWIFERQQKLLERAKASEAARKGMDSSLPQLVTSKKEDSDNFLQYLRGKGQKSEESEFDSDEGLPEKSAGLVKKHFDTRSKMGAFEAAVSSPDFSQVTVLRPK